MNISDVINVFSKTINEHKIKNKFNIYKDYNIEENNVEIFCLINDSSGNSYELQKIIIIYPEKEYSVITPWMQIFLFGKILNKNGLKITDIKNESGYSSFFNYMFRKFYDEN